MIIFIFAAFSAFVNAVSLIMLLPHKLNKKCKNIIKEFGIVHFTTEEAAEKIICTSVVKANRRFRCAYFFQNGIVSRDGIKYNNLENKMCRVVIQNLTELRLNRLRIRYFDMAVICFGDFKLSETNQVSVEKEAEITPQASNLYFYFYWSVALLLVSFVILISSLVKLII